MGVFSSRKVFFADPSLIPAVCDELVHQLQYEGYDVQQQPLLGGDRDISITKGGMFKAVLGMKTAMKVTMRGNGNQIVAEASVGIFGQQAIPTVITLLFFWPVLLTQVWGMIQQSQLDDHVVALIEKSILRMGSTASRPGSNSTVASSASRGSFCPDCGTAAGSGKFCTDCGTKLG